MLRSKPIGNTQVRINGEIFSAQNYIKPNNTQTGSWMDQIGSLLVPIGAQIGKFGIQEKTGTQSVPK